MKKTAYFFVFGNMRAVGKTDERRKKHRDIRDLKEKSRSGEKNGTASEKTVSGGSGQFVFFSRVIHLSLPTVSAE